MDNKLPGRSYFIPYQNIEESKKYSPKEKRYKSSKVICLNGDWDFKFYPLPKELPDILNTEEIKFDKIDVPSCWQFRGYYHPFYVNIRYQFPFNPPKIPTEEEVGTCFTWLGFDQKISLRWTKPKDEYNFVGVYRRFIKIDDLDKNYIISFLGVSPCLDLYINGQYVGYSEGSHNTAEFDLTKYLVKGDNELLAVVHRWCNGTYLEDQDMFRNNGIFRDVLLRVSDKDDIYDIDAKTAKENGKYSLTLKAELFNDTDVTFYLEGNGLSLSKKVKSDNKVAEVTFDNLEVIEWNAEKPTLYDIYYETDTCSIHEKIGFKNIEIKGDKFYLNDKLIKFHGVNHHDTNPKNGYSMTPDEIEKDVLLCKEFNIDMIRTSHYPPDPLLIELADLHGIYIIDENDLETHGTWACQIPPTFKTITHNKKWEGHYLDRISRLYQRDKIHANTSIVMWSLGNEAGGYYNTDKMYEYLKARSNLPVHYESAIHSKRIAYDVGSEMYPSPYNVKLVGEHQRKQAPLNDRPYIMCEYVHAMGVGPGDVESYWKYIYQYENLMGGCVWEMVDHAVLHEDGSYTYGGDHGEWEHDGNFCCDGLFYPDRKPSTGAFVIKHSYRPIRVRHIKDDIFEIFNTRSFVNAKEYGLVFNWNDGTKETYHFDVDGLNRAEVKVPLGKEINGNLSIIVDTIGLDKKTVIAQEEIIIKEHVDDIEGDRPLPECFKYENNKVVIELSGGEKLVSAEEYQPLYRAATDNDTNVLFINAIKPFYDQKDEALSVNQITNGIEIVTKVSNKKYKYIITDKYEGCKEGIIVTSKIHPLTSKGFIPRFGKCFYLSPNFDDVNYLGRSGETYNDMREQFVIKEVKCKVLDMTEPNIRPQESGNRMDCRFATISSPSNRVSFIALKKPFELEIKPYSDRELLKMKHRNDEIRTGTYVSINAFQQGFGSGSCGPYVAPEYMYLADKDYEYKFLIKID